MGTDRLDNIDLAVFGPMTIEEALAISNGQDLNAHRAERLELDEIAKEAERYMLAPPCEWPSLEFNWDFSVDAQRFTLDGCKLESFAKCFPRGLRLGWVALHEFDSKLSLQNRRELAELWTVGDQGKLARAIEYIRRKKPITPPLVVPLTETMQVCLGGGNHRYTVAKFSEQIELPIYVAPEKAEAISAIVTIRWL